MRPDDAVLGNDDLMAVLAAVAAGRVVRGGSGTETTIYAPHLLDGQDVRPDVQVLHREELIEMPISGPPRLAPRGVRLLGIIRGEVAAGPAGAG
jgi:hypothetical protein